VTVLRSGAATDVGRVRSSNQDAYLESLNLFAVADGMGGHAGGEVAARMAIDTFRSTFSLHPTLTGLRQAITEANLAVWREGQVQSDLRGMGTTITAAALVSAADGHDVIAVANVGDSRAYVFSDGRLTQVTADHSLAEEKVRLGELSEAEAAVHPHRHILTRALGIGTEVEVDLWELHLDAGDRVLLCSDGLTNEVEAGRIAELLASVPDPQQAAEQLVQTAVKHGGHDNVTVVVIDVQVGEEGRRPVGGAAAAEIPAPVPLASSAASAAALSPSPAVLPAPAPAVEAPVLADDGRRPSRRERRARRRLEGIPRRITFRVVLFTVLLLGVVALAYGFVRWYATDNWYVTTDGTHLAVYQGRPGGMLWFKPKLVERSPVTTSEVLPEHLAALKADVDKPSLAAARRYIQTLHDEYLTQGSITKSEKTAPIPTTTLVSPFATPPPPPPPTTTTTPSATTTTAPGATPTTTAAGGTTATTAAGGATATTATTAPTTTTTP
jgi:protein phosphatase